VSPARRERPAAAAPLGVGVDLVENERVRRAVERWGGPFLQRVFRPGERAYCDAQAVPWRHYAGRFAVKEAVSKAFGTGIGDRVGWLDIEVRRDPESGAPSVRLFGRARRLAAERGVDRVLISLAHTRELSVAEAVVWSRRAPPARPAARRPRGRRRRAT
jgi:holo-[acyl-carrier protein] synthase